MLCVVDGICPSTSASPLDISVENMYGFGAFRWLLIMHQYAEAVYYEGLHAWRSVCEARAQPSTSGSGVICTCSPQVRRNVYGALTHNVRKGHSWRGATVAHRDPGWRPFVRISRPQTVEASYARSITGSCSPVLPAAF